MAIPDEASTVDFLYKAFDLRSERVTSIATRTDFSTQKALYDEKITEILDSLQVEHFNDDTRLTGPLYLQNALSLFQGTLKDLNHLLGSLGTGQTLEKNIKILISYWYLPFTICVIQNLKDIIPEDSTLAVIEKLLYEILTGNTDNKFDINKYSSSKVRDLIPRGVSMDIRNDLSSQKNIRSIAYPEYRNFQLISTIESDLKSTGNEGIIPKFISTVKACGLLRKSLKGFSLNDLAIGDYKDVIDSMKELHLTPKEVENNLNKFKTTNSTKAFVVCSSKLKSKLLKPKAVNTLRPILDKLPRAIIESGIELSLISLHQHTENLSGFTNGLHDELSCQLLSDSISQSEKVKLFTKTHEIARREFTNFAYDLVGNENPNDILQLCSIIISSSIIASKTVKNNQNTKILSIVRSCLPSTGDFIKIPSFHTVFHKAVTIIDSQRFTVDSQLLAFCINFFNKMILSIFNLSVSPNFLPSVTEKLVFLEMAREMHIEELVDSYKNGTFDTKIASKLNEGARFWRLDNSTAYEYLRDIEFYIEVVGPKIDSNNVIELLGISKYRKLNNSKKRKILKLLDPEQYEKDEDISKNHTITLKITRP